MLNKLKVHEEGVFLNGEKVIDEKVSNVDKKFIDFVNDMRIEQKQIVSIATITSGSYLYGIHMYYYD